MNTIVQHREPSRSIIAFEPEEVDLIKSTICVGASDTELKLFLYQCQKTGLDPLARQAYAVKRWDGNQRKEVMSIQTSIDGFRLIAERTKKYAGQTPPEWCGKDGKWVDVWLSDDSPIASRIGVLRHDFKEPCWGVARFKAYAQTNKEGALTKAWRNMGDIMIAKCAEALALRKAFPQELSGIYTNDEMEQAAQDPESSQTPIPPRQPTLSPPPAPKPAPITEHQPLANAPLTPQAWAQMGIDRIATFNSKEELHAFEDKYGDKIARLADALPDMHKKLVDAIADRHFVLDMQ